MKFKKLLLLMLIAISSNTLFAQAKKKSPIDGRIYSIKLLEENKKKAEPFMDDISFMAGKCKSNYMFNAKFMQADYQYETDSTAEVSTFKFTVESNNDAQGRFSWEGTIEGDNISGTASIRKKGKIIHSYTFTGSQKNKKKVKPASKPSTAQSE